ncbi:hypothetical protein [Mesorhizobium sangaii]|uniref:Uncharacterized protein n=1 Tax=Mesorhizobium sangaii TaxID=505389 RepID=A0A841P7B8_9HYPH|nr:hypothetical protein [Mesorhizobium sangaii]MBB6411107.1 hypothetical protein [Mesorhizobium sangaii]
MTDEQGKAPNNPVDSVVRRLVDETGITEAQARELIALLGALSWSSLLREARIMSARER